MNNRISIIGIVVKNRKEVTPKINQIITDFGEIIIGRMGIPYRERNLSVISLIVDGTTDQIGALTGKLGQLEGVRVKSIIAY